MALTIPTVTKDNFELLNDNMELIADKMTDQQKAQIAQFTFEKQQAQEEKKLREVLFRANHPALAKARDVVTKGWEKLIKGQWFKKAGNFLRGMAASAGGWLRNLLAIVTLLNSGILQEMLPWLFQVGSAAIRVLIKWTPTILKFVWQILTRMVPQLLKGIFNSVFDTLGLPNDHPIRKFFNYIFDNIPKFADVLLKIFKDVFIFIGELGNKAWNSIQSLISWFKGGGVGRIVDRLKTFLEPIIPVLLALKNVIDAIIPVAWNLVKNVFGSFLTFFDDLKNKPIGEALKDLFKNLIRDVYSFLEDFSKSVLPKIIKFGVEYVKIIAKAYGAVLGVTLTVIKSLATAIGELFYEYILSPIGNTIKDIFFGVINSIVGTYQSLEKKVKKFLIAPLYNFFIKTLPKWWVNMVKSVKEFIFKIIPSLFKKAANFIWSPIKDIFYKFVSLFEPITKFLDRITKIDAGAIIGNLEGSLSSMWARITGTINVPESVKKTATTLAKGAREFVKNPGAFINKIFNSLSANIKEIPNKVLEAVTGVFDWVVAFFRTLGELVSSIDIRNPRKFLSKVSSFTEDLNRNVQEAVAEKKLQKSGESFVSERKKSISVAEYQNLTSDERDKYKEKYTTINNARRVTSYERRAKGGKVAAGETYMTGEKGTELFTPTEHGNITPNSEIKDMLEVLKRILEVLQQSNNGGGATPTFVPLTRAR